MLITTSLKSFSTTNPAFQPCFCNHASDSRLNPAAVLASFVGASFHKNQPFGHLASVRMRQLLLFMIDAKSMHWLCLHSLSSQVCRTHERPVQNSFSSVEPRVTPVGSYQVTLASFKCFRRIRANGVMLSHITTFDAHAVINCLCVCLSVRLATSTLPFIERTDDSCDVDRSAPVSHLA